MAKREATKVKRELKQQRRERGLALMSSREREREREREYEEREKAIGFENKIIYKRLQ